jgi:hypothetical protein
MPSQPCRRAFAFARGSVSSVGRLNPPQQHVSKNWPTTPARAPPSTGMQAPLIPVVLGAARRGPDGKELRQPGWHLRARFLH